MRSKPSPQLKTSDHTTERLRTESAKLRCLSHLIESQREPEGAPLDAVEINMGLAAILGECSAAVRAAAEKLED